MKELHVLPLDLSDKHALVCGASQGIGLAAAQQLAGLEARVTLLARNLDRLHRRQSPTLPGEGHAVAVADFQRPDEVKRVAEGIVDANDVYILINNSGRPAGGSSRKRPKKPSSTPSNSI